MNKKIYLAAAIMFIMLVSIGIFVASASSPPPGPVPQQLGKVDTQFPNVTVPTCRGCHGGQPTGLKPHPAANLHHYMLPQNGKPGNTTLGCADCHPNVPDGQGGYSMYIEENCKNCHNGTAWYMNSIVNLSVIRGLPGRPHHNTTKASSSNFAFNASYASINRQCKVCHGEGLLDNYDDGHLVKYLSPQAVSVFADYKVNASISGNVNWGGCAACHEPDASNPLINNNHDTHHYETTSMLGRQCNYCHVGDPAKPRSPAGDASPFRVWFNDTNSPYYDDAQWGSWDTSFSHIEVNNRTLYLANDIINATGCTKCHSYRDLHNIEGPSPSGDAKYNMDHDIGGYGHIGNSTDCNGCHANGGVIADQRPVIAPISVGLSSVSPSNWVSGTDTDVTLVGDNLNQAPNYTTSVLVDGQPVTIKSNTGTEIVATVPGTTTAGTHDIVVSVGGVASPLFTFSIAAPVSITSATLSGTTLTITGTSFGDAQQAVTITKTTGDILSDSIQSWAGAQIVAVSSQAAVGDIVTVTTASGSATATIQTGTVQDSVTVTSPNGGENWKQKSAHAITWNKAGNSQAANVKIELLKGGAVVKTIASRTTNDGSQSWSIGSQATGTNYQIKITSVGHTPAYSDTSDGYFTISK